MNVMTVRSVAWLILMVGASVARTQDTGDENPRHRARYYAARFALQAEGRPQAAVTLCREILDGKPSAYTPKAHLLIGHAFMSMGEPAKAAEEFAVGGDRIQEGAAWFDAADYRKAMAAFDAELAIPEVHHPFGGKGGTPKADAIAIRKAWCLLRMDDRPAAYAQARRLYVPDFHWDQSDRKRLIKLLVETCDGNAEELAKLKATAAQRPDALLLDYFDIMGAVREWHGDVSSASG